MLHIVPIMECVRKAVFKVLHYFGYDAHEHLLPLDAPATLNLRGKTRLQLSMLVAATPVRMHAPIRLAAPPASGPPKQAHALIEPGAGGRNWFACV